MGEIIVVADTSVLINFLVLDQAGWLGRLPNHRFVVTDHVRAEITDHYPDQLRRLQTAFAIGILEEMRVTDFQELQLFAGLTATGLGVGECSAIAVAVHRKFTLAIDDNRAVKKIKNAGLDLSMLSTESVVVLLIRHSVLTIQEADTIKEDWEKNHSFRLLFASFRERI
jgi:predicted nucleic acid-binding protein